MSSQVAANQSNSTKRTQSLLAKSKTWARIAIGWIAQAAAVFGNVTFVSEGAGAAIAAGAQLATGGGVVTVVQRSSGWFRVSGWFSGTAPAGNVTPIFGAAAHSAVIPVLVAMEQDTTTQPKNSFVYLFKSGGAIGSSWDFSFTTTAGDQTVTLGHGAVAGSFGAGLLVEELPTGTI